MHVQMVPFGNAYFNTTECGRPAYDRDQVACYRKACGSDPAADCFSGPLLCQHGEDECLANRLEGCAFLSTPFPAWVPFVACYEKDGDLSVQNAQKCALASKLEYTTMAKCEKGAQGKGVDLANARATLAYSGDWMGTPTVTVAGVTVSNPAEGTNLLDAVCKAYKGYKPAACK
eukprot:TRINITY_DN27237_c0_g1_i1.p1 TRINITY_DN27237_c0_g1~~TRINITY_DN27237_c0_g1_i1.p1  ORF type:complete len:174 (+),score=25.87 TRINITY_DN27237_c0_g1_i1:319-840(+)